MNVLQFASKVSFIAMLGWSLLLPAFAEDWPQWRGPHRDGVWSETGIIEKFAADRIKPEWSAPIGSGFSGPTVADGRVYVTDRQAEPKEVERVLCFDAKTGNNRWTHSYFCPYKVEYPIGPRASVSIDHGRAYALGTMGHLHCLDAGSGAVVWKKDLQTEYAIDLPIWGISASPLVDGDDVFLHIGGSNGACILALDKDTGAEKWKALDEPASYAAPILIEQAGQRVLVCWTGASVSGLDPATGKVYWAIPFKPKKMVLNVATPVADKDRLLVSAFYDGSLMLKLRQDKVDVEEVWRRCGKSEQKTDSLHAIISTPLLDGGFVYGVDSYGELRCLAAATGDRVWENLTAGPNVRWGTIHMVRNGNKMWMFNELGELIIGKLSPTGFEEISRAKLIEPTTDMDQRTEPICWSHPAFAGKHVFARNDKELVCANLEAK
jgi:outer membrane protein assembly factor BamB